VGFDFPCLVYSHLGARLTEEGVMQWLTIAWWRWRLAQARGRNALVRTSDRVEVAVMALAIAVSLAAMPVAGAIGTAVHDAHAKTYAAERQDRHKAETTAKDSAAPRWQVGDVENAGAFSLVKEGPSLDVWVDRNGRRVAPPAPSWQAGADAIVAAMVFWLSVTAVAALLVALVRRGLKRARYAGWNREIASLVDDDGGKTNRRR
jgi:hypothetical protein